MLRTCHLPTPSWARAELLCFALPVPLALASAGLWLWFGAAIAPIWVFLWVGVGSTPLFALSGEWLGRVLLAMRRPDLDCYDGGRQDADVKQPEKQQ